MELTEYIKHGFKETKIGWIPIDWNLKTLKDVCEVKGRIGYRGYTVNDIVPKGEGAITISPSNIKGTSLSFDDSTYISWYKYEESKEIQLQSDDILLVKTGSTFGKSALVKELKEKATINPQLVIIKNINCNVKYLSYLISDEIIQRQIFSVVVGGAIPTLSQENILKFAIPLPSLHEQKKIASFLSDWDKAIETTTNLIEKLKLRKKGLCQELLIGKKRLTGFTDEWQKIKAGDIFVNHTNKNHNGKLEVLSATQENGVIPRSETGIDIKYDKASLKNYKKIDIGDFVISLRSFQGGIEYSNYEGLVSPAYTVLKEMIPISKEYFREYFKTQNFINRLNSIIYGIRDGKQISYKEFSSLKISIPSLNEQKAIANILLISDIEIKKQQEYLEQLQKQKKGLMQQLLTGKIRVNSKYE
ncbi:restriction endonuclease subunit S [Flagellimonas olearia]|uniref:Type I restriction modification DNA specificity domain-containing protein n=1 Tax=Flagellimonas olearia TaxID=552546 RepID=A0A444VMC8_9FLAO|nr:restriction endonuclease subunit S [Allomuricauda olearia]RYC51862.1 hypothetical protein DN53_08210 [Allomuricauda olearia]